MHSQARRNAMEASISSVRVINMGLTTNVNHFIERLEERW
jgi:hypothetical protein